MSGETQPMHERDDIHPGMITVAVMLATLMQVIDTTIANVALPHMQGSLSATTDQVAWVLTSYIVASAIMTPPTGWLAGRFGRRRLFLTAIIGFVIASFFCGTSTSLVEMVIFRVLQGVFGAALVPISQAILLDSYPKEKHGVAMAMWGIGIMLGPILGPTLGGYLTEYYNWRWVFWINIPVGVIAVLMTISYVPETGKDRERKFDWFGFTALSIAIGSLQLLLDRGQGEDWFESGEIVLETVLAVGGLYFFIVHALFKHHPFIDLRMFRDRNFLTSTSMMFVVGVILLATMSLIPPMLQNLMQYPVITTGLVLAPRGLGAMFSMMVVSRLITRIDPRLPVLAGLLLVSFALYQMSGFSLTMDARMVVWTGVVQGLGLGLIFVPLSTIAFSTLEPRMRTEASGVFNLVRNIGSSVGVSIVFTLFARNSQINHAEIGARLTPFSDSLQQFAGNGVDSAHAVALLNAEVSRQASMIAFVDDFHFMMIVTLCAIPLLIFMRGIHPNTAVRARRPAE